MFKNETNIFFLPFCINNFGQPFSWKSWLWIIFEFENFSFKTCLTDWSTGFWGYSWLLMKGMKVFSKKSGRERTSKAPGCGWRRYLGATQGSTTGRATRPGFSKPGFFWPGEKFNFEPGTRPRFKIQPGNRPGPEIPGLGRKTRPGKTQKPKNGRNF